MCEVTQAPDVELPPRIVGPSLTVAGLAAWVFAQSSREEDSRRCGDLQDLLDAALTRGQNEVLVPRTVLVQAADLWEQAADLLDAQVGPGLGFPSNAEAGLQAERLRVRARSVRKLL